jgi:hypothetical protein
MGSYGGGWGWGDMKERMRGVGVGVRGEGGRMEGKGGSCMLAVGKLQRRREKTGARIEMEVR